jgi:hypothetical protein
MPNNLDNLAFKNYKNEFKYHYGCLINKGESLFKHLISETEKKDLDTFKSWLLIAANF